AAIFGTGVGVERQSLRMVDLPPVLRATFRRMAEQAAARCAVVAARPADRGEKQGPAAVEFETGGSKGRLLAGCRTKQSGLFGEQGPGGVDVGTFAGKRH